MLKDSAMGATERIDYKYWVQILRFAELHVEDSAMGQVKWRSMNYGCKQGATLKCIKTKEPYKQLTCKALSSALQDGLEPTTP